MLCVKKMRNLLLHFYMLKMALFLGFFSPGENSHFLKKRKNTYKKSEKLQKIEDFCKKRVKLW